MKKNKVISTIAITIAVFIAAGLVSCKKTQKPTPEPITLKVKNVTFVGESPFTLEKGQPGLLVYEVVPAAAASLPATWSCDDESIVSFRPNGHIFGESVGSTKVHVEVGGVKASCIVVVTNPGEPYYNVESVIFTCNSPLDLYVGQTYQSELIINPPFATCKIINWGSKNEKVVSISGFGLIKAESVGTTDVYAEVDGVKGSLTVNVKKVEVTGLIFLDGTNYTINVGETKKLEYEVTPSIAQSLPATWTSSDDSIAVVDANGNVTGVNKGETRITLEVGGVRSSCSFTVDNPSSSGIIIK